MNELKVEKYFDGSKTEADVWAELAKAVLGVEVKFQAAEARKAV